MLAFILFVFFGMFLAWNVFTTQPKWSKWLYEKPWKWIIENLVMRWVRKAAKWLRSI